MADAVYTDSVLAALYLRRDGTAWICGGEIRMAHTAGSDRSIFVFGRTCNLFLGMSKCLLSGKDGEWIIRLVYAALVLLVFYSMYTPNIFGRGELSDAYHGHAYFNSVYNIYQGMPYTHNVTSIYGHYGLFFKIPMELVHGDFKAFVAMVAGIGAFAHICAFLILELLVKSRVLRVTWCFGSYISCTWYARWLLLAGLAASGNFSDAAVSVWSMDPQKRAVQFPDGSGGYLICLLAILWNTETGLILTVAWAGMLNFTFSVCGKNKDP